MNRIKECLLDPEWWCCVIFGGLIGFALTLAFERAFGGW